MAASYFGNLPDHPRTLPEFQEGDLVGYSTRANVGIYLARVTFACYSTAWNCWVYNLAVMGDSADNIVQCVMECNLVRAS